MADDEQTIRDLLRDGQHRKAAELLVARGELKRAMEAYAAVWEYGRAAELACEAGDLPRALDFALRDGARDRAAEIRRELARADAAEAERAVALLLDRGEQDQAARLLEARGDLEQAAELLKSTGELRRAAALLEGAGRHREAGRLYERLLEENEGDGPAAFSLATILASFGRHEPAARMYQVAAKDGEVRKGALRGLVASLHQMGLRDAAQAALEELLVEDASAPRSVEALVASEERADRDPGEEDWLGGRYRVVRLLGGGAAGRVYLASDALYEREVALKVLSTGGGGAGGRDAFSRFAREAQIAARLEHPNIVRVLDFDEKAGLLVMEHLAGGTLADRLGPPHPPLAVVREVFLALLRALESAHLRGVIHRDVKPQNVLFGRAGEVKLADFGVAHLQDHGLTQTGAFIGTLTYMAPEQITGDRLSAATDLYALGATMLHALCGRPPFVGADLVRQHLADDAPRPSELRPSLGTRFDVLFARLLAKVPEERFASAAEVRGSVEGLDFAEPVGDAEPPPPPPQPIEAESDADPLEPVGPAEEGPRGRTRRARHRALDADVEILEVRDAEQLAGLRSFGKVFDPYLQQVLDADAEESTALLALPDGRRLSELLAEGATFEPEAAFRMASELARACASLEASGAGHGEVSPELVVVGRYRTTLLLPALPPSGPTGTCDAAQIVATVAAALRAPGPLSELLRSEAVAAHLSSRRGEALAEAVPTTLGLDELRTLLARISEALDERAAAEEHLHALAASARAAGADPREGPLAEFLAERKRALGL